MDPYLAIKDCALCPRKGCDGQRGFCGQKGSPLRIALAGLHFGEEPPITLFHGSGTVFITGCNLRCKFCQNYQISQGGLGKEVSSKEFTKICLLLQEKGAQNINLVTPSHKAATIASYLKDARSSLLTIPVCYNSSGYDSLEALEELKDVVDIYLPDLKTLDPARARALFNAPDYPKVAQEAIRWMVRERPLKIEGGVLYSGVIIRHLFLPGNIEDTYNVLRFLKDEVSGSAYISLMTQYTPIKALDPPPSLENRLVNKQEYQDLLDLIKAFDFPYVYYQELSSDTDWLPDFFAPRPFSSSLFTPLYHCLY